MASGRGGGRSSGGSRSSSSGGSSGGFRGSSFRGPRFYRRGHGGSTSTNLFAGIVCLFIGIVVMAIAASPFFISIFTGGVVKYDEEEIQDYTDAKYDEVYGDTNCYEDNILVVFLVDDEEYYNFYFCGWTGSHVVNDIRLMFNGDDSFFDDKAENEIGEYYKHSLDDDLSAVIDLCTKQVNINGIYNSFKDNCECSKDRDAESVVYNYSTLDFESGSLQEALNDFAVRTKVAISFVIEDADKVFDRGVVFDFGVAMGLFVPGIFVLVGIYIIVISIPNKKKKNKNKYIDDDNDNSNSDDENTNNTSASRPNFDDV